MRIVKIVAISTAVLVCGAFGLVGYAAATADSKLAFPDHPAPETTASKDPEVIARGKYLVHGPAHCVQCHTTAVRSDPALVKTTPLQGGLKFEMGPIGTTYARNLTPDPETGIGNISDALIGRTLRTGVMHDGELSFFMRLAASELAEEDVIAVLSYLRSLEPVSNEVPRGGWALFGKVLLTYAFPPLRPRETPPPAWVPASEEPSIERGRYLADHVALCTTCHSAFDMATFERTGPKAGGSLPDPSHGEDADKEFVAPNLTPHPTGITGRMDENAFVARLKAGRMFPSSIMPWESFSDTTETDLRSIYRYLASLPPVDNDVGPTYRDKGWQPGA